MPKDSTSNALARQWEILKLLPRRGDGITAQQITAALADKGYALNQRSVQRDLQQLRLSFQLQCDEQEKPYRWKWDEHAPMELSALTAEEAISLGLIEQATRELLPQALLQHLQPRFEQARNKLQSLQGHRAVSLAQSYRFVSHAWPLQAAQVDDAILQNIEKALSNGEQVRVQYLNGPTLRNAPFQDQPPEGKEYILHPLGLINRGPSTYLLATNGHYSDPRLYALHRMLQAQTHYEPSKAPLDFSLDSWVDQHMQFGSGQTIRLIARVTAGLAHMLLETPLSEDQIVDSQSAPLKGEKRSQLQATVTDSMQLAWWILSQGPDIEIVQPASLRDAIAKRVAQAHSQYVQT